MGWSILEISKKVKNKDKELIFMAMADNGVDNGKTIDKMVMENIAT